MDTNSLEKRWDELYKEASSSSDPISRVYGALGGTAIGVRAGFVPIDETYELLIEIPSDREDLTLPEWRGLQLEEISLRIQSRDTNQLRFILVDIESKEIFLCLASDLVSSLEDVTDQSVRMVKIAECLDRWSSFFARTRSTGLPETAQRGLIAELVWIEQLLDIGLDGAECVKAWQGCRQAYHDYDHSGRVVEIKSTIGKEPRRVWINNERQLDDRGLVSLHLFVVTFQEVQSGRALPEVIEQIRQRFESSVITLAQFNRNLISAGYLDVHEAKYSTAYIVKEKDIFMVVDGFPRLLSVPEGVGNLRYSIVLGACQNFKVYVDDILRLILEDADVG